MLMKFFLECSESGIQFELMTLIFPYKAYIGRAERGGGSFVSLQVFRLVTCFLDYQKSKHYELVSRQPLWLEAGNNNCY